MKTIVILNAKGGVGKSNITRHLAVAAELERPGSTVLCDTDPQSSLADWWNARAAENPPLAVVGLSEYAEIQPILAERFEYLFFDTAAANAEPYREILKGEPEKGLKGADLIVIPVCPSPDDLRSLDRITLPVVKSVGRPFIFVISKARLGTQLLVSTMAALSQHGEVTQTIIQERTGYAKASLTGSTLIEDEPTGKGADEMRELWSIVRSRIDEKVITATRVKGLVNV